jgi:hypothetical protein
VRCLVRYCGWAGLLCLLFPRLAPAAYEPERLPDTSRRWAINVGFFEYYNDNIDTTTKNPTAGQQSYGEIALRVNVPAEQTFFRMNTTYGVTYSPDRPSGKTEQSVVFAGLLSHTFTPRLVANLNETFRYALEPAVSDIINGQSTQLQQSGNYIENNTTTSISYDLSHRWVMTARGGWDLWRYETSVNSSNYDRDVYSGGMDLVYSLTPRSFVGAGYSYTTTDYVDPGSNSFRNADSNYGYLSFSHAFNPQLSINLDAGAQLVEYPGGTQDTSPAGDLALNYNVSKDMTVSAGFRYGLQTYTSSSAFRSTDTETFFAQANYRITQKLQASASGFYSYSTYQNPNPLYFAPGAPIPKSENSFSVNLSLAYMFNVWSSATLNYSHQEVNSDFSGGSFTQNRVGVGVSLHY